MEGRQRARGGVHDRVAVPAWGREAEVDFTSALKRKLPSTVGVSPERAKLPEHLAQLGTTDAD